jgi:4-aminobutyrate aminotransferase-like enzyme
LAEVLRPRLEALAARYPRDIEGVWGLGPMLALCFRDARDASGKSLAHQVVAAAFDFGLIALTAGPGARVVRILVPLLASADELERGLSALERACERVLAGDAALAHHSS